MSALGQRAAGNQLVGCGIGLAFAGRSLVLAASLQLIGVALIVRPFGQCAPGSLPAEGEQT